jgi:hypothetical protein
MMRNKLVILLFLMGSFAGKSGAEAQSPHYFFPFVNPFEATVIPLPEAYKEPLHDKIPIKTFKLDVLPDREVPDVFWYQRGGLTCSLASQDHMAPMLFIIAGTGAHYNSPNMLDLQQIFYKAGFHVICISSPTYMNFVVNASTGMPGNTPEDAKDLYRVMKQADAYAKKRGVEVSSYALTGYSLGGIESAFLSKLDDERKVFNFKRVLLINPPADVYTSISLLDGYLTDNIPGGVENFTPWFKDTMAKVAKDAKSIDDMNLSPESIYKLYRYYPPREDFLKALIGLSFRMSSANMVFTVDVMKNSGYIVPKNTKLTNSSSLTKYAMTSYSTSFVDYYNELFYPYYAKQEAGLTREALMKRASLYSIESYIKNNPKIGLLHNEDDVIMDQGEVLHLKSLFGEDRAKVFPIGGHCGNMSHPDAARFMANFLMGKEVAK